MKFPTWNDFSEKLSEFEKNIIVRKITVEALKQLSSGEHQFIKAYQESMMNYYFIWTQVYPQLAIAIDPIAATKIKAQLREIIRKMCTDWGTLVNYMDKIGINLRTYYRYIEDICLEQ